MIDWKRASRTLIGLFAVIVFVSAFATDSRADTAEHDPDRWTFMWSAYLQAADIEGTVTVGPFQPELDVDFSTIVDHLDGAFTTHFEAMKAPGGIAVDYLYLNLGVSDIPTSQEGITADLTLKMTNFELFGFYRVGDPNVGAGALDILGGTRYRKMDNSMELRTPMPRGGDVEFSWWDLLAGGRWSKQVHPRVLLMFRGDAGADAYNFQGGASINLFKRGFLLLQYKYLNFDYEDGMGRDRRGYDASEAGPLFGFGVRF